MLRDAGEIGITTLGSLVARLTSPLGALLLLAFLWPAAAAQLPKSFEELEAYLEENRSDLRRKLKRYNEAARLTISQDGHTEIDSMLWKIERLEGDRVFLVIVYDVGKRGWNKSRGAQLFELVWRDGELAFVGHAPPPRRAGLSGGWLGDSSRGCIDNYYAPNPCPGALRRWAEFAEFHGLPMNPETAAVFQAYRQHDVTTGDRLLARARGEPDTTGESVFPLQAEIQALDPRRYEGSPDNPCSIDPYGPRPCIELLPKFKEFAERHGLPPNRATGKMFEAYAFNDYPKADTLYALAKNLPVPKYGYVSTGIGRDAALAGLRMPQEGEAGGCSFNPYDPKPCLESLEAWRRFAASYELADNAANAAIFAAYAEGDLKTGDRLFASAKGVALDQLLEAAGVPPQGLVIEVYPGRS